MAVSWSRRVGVAVMAAACVSLGAGTWSEVEAQSRQQRQQRPAPKPEPPKPLPPPEIVVTGLRVVGPGQGPSRDELRPFNWFSGTSVYMVLRMPAGWGIVEIDGSASVLETFMDDTGFDLAERSDFGSFPDMMADGSAAGIEVRSEFRPTPASTRIGAKGTLAISASPGSKPTKATIKLEAGATTKVGAATLTIDDLDQYDSGPAAGFSMPRSLYQTIRDIKFFDAKGEPLAAERTGRGYGGDTAFMSYVFPSGTTSVTMEFDQWQDVRSEKVPFEFSVGVGLAPARPMPQ